MSRFIITLAVLVFAFVSLTEADCQNMSKKALLVLDVQENLVDPESRLHIDYSNLDVFFMNLNSSIELFNEMEDLVIYIINEWSNPVVNLFTGNACKKGGEGVGLDKRLKVVNDILYSKSRPNALTNEALLDFLRVNEITEVFVAGLFAEACVKATSEGLLKENFRVSVIGDALGSKNEDEKAKTIEYFEGIGIKVVNSAKL